MKLLIVDLKNDNSHFVRKQKNESDLLNSSIIFILLIFYLFYLTS